LTFTLAGELAEKPNDSFREMMGHPAICRGKPMMRSHSRQQKSARKEMEAHKPAASRHSIAALKGNPFLSSRRAPWHFASTRPATSNNDRL